MTLPKSHTTSTYECHSLTVSSYTTQLRIFKNVHRKKISQKKNHFRPEKQQIQVKHKLGTWEQLIGLLKPTLNPGKVANYVTLDHPNINLVVNTHAQCQA